MSVLIRVRRDTAANWAAENPVLGAGEPGLSEDERIMKWGNGVNAWADLPGLSVDIGSTGGGEPGVTDHGGLLGLGDDDHPQYLNNARGDARYWALTTTLATQAALTNEATTRSNADNLLDGRIDTLEPKLAWITVTQAVDLDTIEARVNSLDAAVVLMGGWAANAGTFPGGGTAQAGASWIVTVAGTVNGIVFNVNDRIVAITDNASSTNYANQWLKLDYTDQVLQVDGQTGNVDLSNVYQAKAAELTVLSSVTSSVVGRQILSAADAPAVRALLSVPTATEVANNLTAAMVAHDADPNANQAAIDAAMAGHLQFSPAFLRNYQLIIDDFPNTGSVAGQIGELGWTTSAAGAGTCITAINAGVGGSNGRPSVQSLNTGAVGATDGAQMNLGKTQLYGHPEFCMEWSIFFPTLNDGTNNATTQIGLHTNTVASAPATPTNGYYWQYSAADTSLHFITTNLSVPTDTDTGFVIPEDVWMRLRVESDGGGVVTAYIDENLVATHSTNIPATAASQQFGLAAHIMKTLGATVGRSVMIDYVYFLWAVNR